MIAQNSTNGKRDLASPAQLFTPVQTNLNSLDSNDQPFDIDDLWHEATSRAPIHTNGNHDPGKGQPAATTTPTPQPATLHAPAQPNLLAVFRALNPDLTTKQIQTWLIDNAEQIAILDPKIIEKIALEAIDRKISRDWLKRSWRPLVNGARREQTTSALSSDIRNEFDQLGYEFSLNACTSEIYLNDEPLNDGTAAEIRVQMRYRGYQRDLRVNTR